jgi:hypothetical protein
MFILAHCFWFGGSASGPAWETFRVTWGPNPLSKHYYVKQPLTVTEAKKEGFTQISTQCNGEYQIESMFHYFSLFY